MTPAESGRLQQKLFEQRRAGLAPPDEGADQAFLATVRIVERAPAGTRLPARGLTPRECELMLVGTLAQTIRGDILRADVVAAHEAARVGQERARSATKAANAEREARRLTAEAARWRDSTA